MPRNPLSKSPAALSPSLAPVEAPSPASPVAPSPVAGAAATAAVAEPLASAPSTTLATASLVARTPAEVARDSRMALASFYLAMILIFLAVLVGGGASLLNMGYAGSAPLPAQYAIAVLGAVGVLGWRLLSFLTCVQLRRALVHQYQH